ncbi:MAG: hypothetical protein AAF500_15205 [Myxococcota bacterium]
MTFEQQCPNSRFAVLVAALLAGSMTLGSAAQAQDTDVPASTTPASVDLTASAADIPTHEDYLWLRLETAEDRSRRARIALITGTGAFVAGAILAAVWSGQNCTSEEDQSICRTDAQPGLSGTGAFLLGSGFITMVTSGIMLGVRNKKKRGVLDEIAAHRDSRAEWDFDSGLLRF